MPPIPLKRIVSVSSEDVQNPASSLLTPSSGRKWLCSQSNRCRTAYVVVELPKRVRISSLELCNFGSAFVEVLVADSESPDNYVTLLHMCMLMSLQESRMGRNKTKVVSCGREKLSSSATSRKWNLVKINCVQKYNHEDQFGLRSFSLFSDGHSLEDQGRNPGLLSPAQKIISSPSSSQQLSKSRRQKEGQSEPRQRHKLPSSSDSLLVSAKVSVTNARGMREHVSSDSSATPERLLRMQKKKNDRPPDQEDFEFSGLERQSRLFRNCLRRKPEDTDISDSDGKIKQNNILSKITADKEKYRESGGLYTRKKLLKKDLPKAELMRDFVASYKEKKGSSEMAGAFRVMSSHDNDYEIGEEPETTWGWNKFKGKRKRSSSGSQSSGVSGWISKRNKLSSMIDQCSDVFKKVGHGEQMRTSSETPAVTSEKECDEATDSDSDTIIYSSPSPSGVNGDSSVTASLVECPLCLSFFPNYAIEIHASICGNDQEPRTAAVSSAVLID